MQKLRNTTKKQKVNTTSNELKYSKSQFNKDFPLLYIHEGLEFRSGITCSLGYYDSEKNRKDKYERDEEMNKYYQSPEWAEEFEKLKKRWDEEDIIHKEEETAALRSLNLTLSDLEKVNAVKRINYKLDRISYQLGSVQKIVEGLYCGYEITGLYVAIDQLQGIIKELKEQ